MKKVSGALWWKKGIGRTTLGRFLGFRNHTLVQGYRTLLLCRLPPLPVQYVGTLSEDLLVYADIEKREMSMSPPEDPCVVRVFAGI